MVFVCKPPKVESHVQTPLVNNTNLHPISHHFQVIVDYWSNSGCRPSLFNTFIRSETLTQDYEIWPKETSKIALLYGVKQIFIY